MRIIHFIESLSSGGKERQLVELLKGLASETSIKCELIIMSDNIYYNYLNKLDIPVHRLLRKARKDPCVFVRLFRLLKKKQPDILHSWGSMCSVYSVPAVKLLNIKFVNGFIRNAPPSISIRNKEWLRSKLTIPFSDAIIANSKAGLRAYGNPKNKFHCIYNGFDFNRLACLTDPVTIKKNHEITTEYVVGMVASFSNKKDYRMFIDAARIVLSKNNNVTFLAVGDGENLDSLRKSVPDTFKKHIIFPGNVKDIESLVQVMTIGVLASSSTHGEGLSNSIMEYMSLGKPVVATDSGGNSELILEGETGYIVQNGHAAKLAERLLFLLDNPNLAEKFGRKGKERLKKMFSLERMTQDYISLYRKIYV